MRQEELYMLLMADMERFQSPPPRRGACDLVTIKAGLRLEAAGVSIPSAEAGGVRLVITEDDYNKMIAVMFQSPPPRRGACDTTAPRSRRPRSVAPFQSPPPRRGACDTP